MLTGTTLSLEIKGCLAFIRLISSDKIGIVAFISIASLALAEIKSSFPIKTISLSIFVTKGISKLESSCKILSISLFSSIDKSFILLLISKTAIGSIYTVEPLLDVS